MRIITAFFDRKGKYGRLLRVFLRSARAVMPGVEVQVVKTKAPGQTGDKKRDHHLDTLAGFLAKAYAALDVTVPTVVCDADLLFLRSVESAFDEEFDVAITRRDARCPFNSGVFFVRPTEAARRFVEDWIAESVRVFDGWPGNDAEVHEQAGIDQAALARVLKVTEANVLMLPCVVWNACQGDWANVTDETRVVHVKSGLRQAVVGSYRRAKRRRLSPPIERLVQVWRTYERKGDSG